MIYTTTNSGRQPSHLLPIPFSIASQRGLEVFRGQPRVMRRRRMEWQHSSLVYRQYGADYIYDTNSVLSALQYGTFDDRYWGSERQSDVRAGWRSSTTVLKLSTSSPKPDSLVHRASRFRGGLKRAEGPLLHFRLFRQLDSQEQHMMQGSLVRSKLGQCR